MFRELITEFYDAAQAQAPPGVTVEPPILEPATPAQIAHAEDTMQLTFTDELREWYLTSNHHFVLGRLMVTLTSKGWICPPEQNFFKSWDHLLPDSGEIVNYNQIFTISSDGIHDFLLYVLAGDRRGEVVRVCFDKLPHQKLVTPMFQSLEAWLRFNIETVRQGLIAFNDSGGFVMPIKDVLSEPLPELLDQHGLPHHWYY